MTLRQERESFKGLYAGQRLEFQIGGVLSMEVLAHALMDTQWRCSHLGLHLASPIILGIIAISRKSHLEMKPFSPKLTNLL